MSNFDGTLRNLAARKLQGIKIDAAGPVTYNGFVRFGVTVNRNAINKMMADMGFKTLRKKFDVLQKFARNLAWISPVYTGYYVGNWQVNPNASASTTSVSEEPSPIGAYISSGSMRRKMELSGPEKDAARQRASNRLETSLEEKFISYESSTNLNTLRDTWAFYNPTPYADKIEVVHGVIAKAASMMEMGF